MIVLDAKGDMTPAMRTAHGLSRTPEPGMADAEQRTCAGELFWSAAAARRALIERTGKKVVCAGFRRDGLARRSPSEQGDASATEKAERPARLRSRQEASAKG
jgi:hypothetical protein